MTDLEQRVQVAELVKEAPPNLLLTYEEVAAYLGISPRSVRTQVELGLPSVAVTESQKPRRRVRKRDLLDWIERRNP